MALEPRGLLLVDPPSLYIIIPLVSEGRSGQLAVWETIHSTNNSTKSISLTLTSWSKPTPHSITPTSPGGASIESVPSVTGEGGHSVHWSQTSSPHIVADHSIGWYSEVRTGGCVHIIISTTTVTILYSGTHIDMLEVTQSRSLHSYRPW